MAEPGKKRSRKAPAEDPPSDPPAGKKRRPPRKAAGAVVEIDRERAELLSRIVEGARRLCEALEGAGSGETRAGSLTAPLRVGGPDGAVPLKEFLSGVVDLRSEECESVARVAEQILEEVYVHLPLKRAMHAVDPIQRLKILRRRLRDRAARAFHAEMLSIFHSLRDLHTNYVLPAPYQGRTAFLPFLVEKYFEDGDRSRPRFIVSKLIGEFAGHGFEVGVNLTHWNGVPIDRVVEQVADREAGSNDDAREARGLEALTLRPLAYSAPPDEQWVVVGFEAAGQAREIRFEWMVFSPPPAPTAPAPSVRQASLATLGLDARTEEARRAKKSLFCPEKIEAESRSAPARGGSRVAGPARPGQSAPKEPPACAVLGRGESPGTSRSALLLDLRAGTSPGPGSLGGPGRPPDEQSSFLPDVFEFRVVPAVGRQLGYVRIFTFMVEDADGFVDEFVRIIRLLPGDGLILDVRGNGGGNILAGERLLQTLTPRTIEPARLQFINTPSTMQLCGGAPTDLDLTRWSTSIGLAVETGEVYSQALPLQPPERANRLGQQYQGPVLLITDALCYSTTDIFAAGFQDHRIGPILGTTRQTGAGGANVWDYALLRASLPGRFPELPGDATFRVAIRRTIRVGDRSGVPVEDFGVEPDEIHAMTRADVLADNVDLIARAGVILAAMPVRSLAAEMAPPGLVAHTRNVTRVDLYQGSRPIDSRAVGGGRAEFALPADLDTVRPLILRGFDGEELVAAATVRLGASDAG